MKLPKISKVVIENFSLYKQKRRIDIDVSNGVLCLAGANGLGKSTFISIVSYAMTGIVVQPDIDFKSLSLIPAFVKKAGGFSDSYFGGRVDERDRDIAQVYVRFRLGECEYSVKRSFFDNAELIEFSRIDAVGRETVNHDVPLLSQYTSFFTEDAELSSFDQYLFLQTYVMTFDESKKLLFWDTDVMNRLMYLFFSINADNAQKADVLRKNIKRYESNMRNIQWDISRMEKRLAKLKGNGIITEEDVHEIEKACDNEDKMRASIESAIKKRQEIDANLKESRLQFDNNILRLHDLRLQYEEVFRSLYDQKVSIEANERIQNSLRKIIVLLTEKEDADISDLVSEMRCEILNAIRQASASRASDERSRLERLKVLDQQIMAQKKAGSELDNKCRRLENELSDSQREILRLNGALEQYRKEHESLLQKKDSIKETEQTRKEIEALKVTIQVRQKEKAEAERMRDESQSELKPLEDEMKRIFTSVEGAFIPTFRGYARSFIGLDIDIDLRDVEGMTSLVINVNGYDRRSRFQLSESQQYFLDIALRFSLIEFSKSKNAFMLIDTPEGSLDIAYENRAGKMFADFVDKGYDVIMTANINSSQLLLKLAERCGKDKMKVERMTDWTMLTQVQQEEQEIIEKAYAQIENKLTMQND